jgi:hypothetical protein
VCNIDKKACNRTAFYHQLQITYTVESEDQMSHMIWTFQIFYCQATDHFQQPQESCWFCSPIQLGCWYHQQICIQEQKSEFETVWRANCLIITIRISVS